MYTPRRDPARRISAHENLISSSKPAAKAVAVETLELRRLLAGNWYDGVPVAESGSLPQDFVQAGDTMFFTADDSSHGRELWKTDGTTSGTQLVKDIRAGADGIGTPDLIAAGNGSVMFILSAPGSGAS